MGHFHRNRSRQRSLGDALNAESAQIWLKAARPGRSVGSVVGPFLRDAKGNQTTRCSTWSRGLGRCARCDARGPLLPWAKKNDNLWKSATVSSASPSHPGARRATQVPLMKIGRPAVAWRRPNAASSSKAPETGGLENRQGVAASTVDQCVLGARSRKPTTIITASRPEFDGLIQQMPS